MKLVTYVPINAPAHLEGRAGILHGETVLDLAALGVWAARHGVALPHTSGQDALPHTMLALLRRRTRGHDRRASGVRGGERRRSRRITSGASARPRAEWPGAAYARARSADDPRLLRLRAARQSRPRAPQRSR